MIILNENQHIDEKIFNETVKELFYSLESNKWYRVSGPDTGEYKQARDSLDGFLNERITDYNLLHGYDDLLGTLLSVTEAQGFVDGFKVASILSTRKSALTDLNEVLSKKMEG